MLRLAAVSGGGKPRPYSPSALAEAEIALAGSQTQGRPAAVDGAPVFAAVTAARTPDGGKIGFQASPAQLGIQVESGVFGNHEFDLPLVSLCAAFPAEPGEIDPKLTFMGPQVEGAIEARYPPPSFVSLQTEGATDTRYGYRSFVRMDFDLRLEARDVNSRFVIFDVKLSCARHANLVVDKRKAVTPENVQVHASVVGLYADRVGGGIDVDLRVFDFLSRASPTSADGVAFDTGGDFHLRAFPGFDRDASLVVLK